MISNSEIRKYVTERIKPFKMKVFGYSMIYFIILAAISSTIMMAIYAVTSILGIGVTALLKAAFNLDGVSQMASSMGNCLSSVLQIAVYLLIFILSIGFMKEILLCVNEKDKTSPVEFFRLGFQDYKRLIKVYFWMYLKYLIASIVMVIGILPMMFGFIMLSNEVNMMPLGVILIIIGVLFTIAGIIASIVIYLRHQTLSYDYIYDEKNLSAKELVKLSRQHIKGYIWKWTRMNFFYKVLFFLAILAITILFVALLFASSMIMLAQNGVATIASIILIFLSVFVLAGGIIVCSIFARYFEAKNILNLNELYKLILKEKEEKIINS